MTMPENQRYKNFVLNFNLSVTARICIFMYTTTSKSVVRGLIITSSNPVKYSQF